MERLGDALKVLRGPEDRSFLSEWNDKLSSQLDKVAAFHTEAQHFERAQQAVKDCLAKKFAGRTCEGSAFEGLRGIGTEQRSELSQVLDIVRGSTGHFEGTEELAKQMPDEGTDAGRLPCAETVAFLAELLDAASKSLTKFRREDKKKKEKEEEEEKEKRKNGKDDDVKRKNGRDDDAKRDSRDDRGNGRTREAERSDRGRRDDDDDRRKASAAGGRKDDSRDRRGGGDKDRDRGGDRGAGDKRREGDNGDRRRGG
eukprot:CAMPEP_0183528736 /NCGR_PEP_ID=MMETSP0371-20130417/22914_1 /TAXON_ID=268820 /ORGANISM="Peridinium aciculiferum, Strain PAER-2" /LENGTH=255 /DNA_ID=CAMNT_0025728397 /DNA_START=96 /DNA_END=860 /DNA_ORIENTATION=-